MLKRFLKKYMPCPHKLRKDRNLSIFGTLLHDPNLWHLNRRSISGGFAIGLFMAFMPVPFQMLIAAGLAILFRVNLPISVVLVFITNPLTIPPICFAAIKLGENLLGIPPLDFAPIELSWEWASSELKKIWKPMVTGCLVFAVTASLLGYVTIRVLWRISVLRKYRDRRQIKR